MYCSTQVDESFPSLHSTNIVDVSLSKAPDAPDPPVELLWDQQL